MLYSHLKDEAAFSLKSFQPWSKTYIPEPAIVQTGRPAASSLIGLNLILNGQVSPLGGTVKSQQVVGQFVKMEVFRCTFFEG